MKIHEKNKKLKKSKKENEENDLLIHKDCSNKNYSLLSSIDTSKNITPTISVVNPSSHELYSLNLDQTQSLENNFEKNNIYEDEDLEIDDEREDEKIFQNTNLTYGKTIFSLFDNYHLNNGVENKNYLYGINNEKNHNSDYLDDVNSIEFISSAINEEDNNHKDELFLDY